MNITFNETEPIFLQIINHIKSEIGTGAISSGDKLPSIRELSKELRVNPNTVGRAYQELEREGITITKRGLGVFINEETESLHGLRDEMALKYLQNFVQGMKSLGFTIGDMIKSLEQLSTETTNSNYLNHIAKEL